MMAVPDDVILYPIISDLSYCLCQEYEQAGESLCFCGIEPATGVPIDIGECNDGKCGAATVRVQRVFPSTNFPDPSAEGICSTLLAAEIVVTVYRCVPVGHDDGSNPTPEEYAGWAQQQFADMAAMRRAIACCFREAHPDVEYVLGDYNPLVPQGGVGGGQWRLLARQEF
jgi:hypothetical protein